MSSDIGLAFIGCGGIVSAHLNGLRILQDHGLDNVRVAGLCSRSAENARRYNERGNSPDPLPPIVPGTADPLNIRDVYVTDLEQGTPAKVYTFWQDVITDPDVDAVVILTPVASHHTIGMAAMAAGKHVLIEKPLAITTRAGRKLCEMAEEENVVLSVAESLRYHIETRAMKWALARDYIGKLEMMIQIGVGSVWSPDKIVGRTRWRHEKMQAGSGILMDVGSHVFDQVRYLMGEPRLITGTTAMIEPMRVTRDRNGEVIETVTCDVEDTAFATMTFDNDVIASFNMSWAGRPEAADMQCGGILHGDMGCIQGGNIISDHKGTLPLVGTFVDTVPPHEHHALFPDGVENPFALELHEFLSAIREGRKPETDGWEGLKAVAMAMAVVESSQRGESVPFIDVYNCTIEAYQRAINDHLGIR